MKQQPWFWPAKLLIKRLSGRELWLRPDFSFDTVESGGWNFVADRLDSNSIVYSLGVGDSIEFVFHPWAASGEDGSLRLFRRVNKRGKSADVMWTADSNAGDVEDFIDTPAYSIQSIMKKLNHERIDLLKMDVEGAEYDILDSLHRVERLPQQLLIEFHHRFPGIGKQRTAAPRSASQSCANSVTEFSIYRKRVVRLVFR